MTHPSDRLPYSWLRCSALAAQRLAFVLAAATATPGCAIKELDPCPDVYTPDNFRCAWKFCKDHPDDPACLDASLDGSSPEDGGLDAGLEDASTDASRCTCEDPEKPVCDEANRCVQCTADDKSACTDDRPVCSTSNVCVQCSADEPQACEGATSLCDVATSTCVACLEHADCKSATAPVCDAHACRGCTADDECAAEGKVCPEQTGECVACTPDKDDPSKENCTSNTVAIPMQGSRSRDFVQADKAAGLTERPTGYTWHHVADFDPSTGNCTIQLVKTDVHSAVSHSGSVHQFEKEFKVKYDTGEAVDVSQKKGWLKGRPRKGSDCGAGGG